MTRPDRTLAWCVAGTQAFATAVADIPDDGWDGATLLPAWSRRTLVAHVARNADALGNLLTWARTGVETPMYASPVERDTQIRDSAAQLPDALAADALAAADRLAVALAQLPNEFWSAQVRTAQGREVPASEIPWMRTREVWVHACDLRARAGLSGVPSDVLEALGRDVLTLWQRRDVTPAVTVQTLDGELRLDQPDSAAAVRGPLCAVVGWLTGRAGLDGLTTSGRVPPLPAWL